MFWYAFYTLIKVLYSFLHSEELHIQIIQICRVHMWFKHEFSIDFQNLTNYLSSSKGYTHFHHFLLSCTLLFIQLYSCILLFIQLYSCILYIHSALLMYTLIHSALLMYTLYSFSFTKISECSIAKPVLRPRCDFTLILLTMGSWQMPVYSLWANNGLHMSLQYFTNPQFLEGSGACDCIDSWNK